jgi:hypothetical protein
MDAKFVVGGSGYGKFSFSYDCYNKNGYFSKISSLHMSSDIVGIGGWTRSGQGVEYFRNPGNHYLDTLSCRLKGTVAQLPGPEKLLAEPAVWATSKLPNVRVDLTRSGDFSSLKYTVGGPDPAHYLPAWTVGGDGAWDLLYSYDCTTPEALADRHQIGLSLGVLLDNHANFRRDVDLGVGEHPESKGAGVLHSQKAGRFLLTVQDFDNCAIHIRVKTNSA